MNYRYPLVAMLTLCISALVGCESSVASSLEESSSQISSSEIISSESSLISSELPSSLPPLVSSIYQNPVYNASFADPSIVRHDDGYFYAYSTGTNIIKSRDLVDWELVGTAISPRPNWGTSGANMWAPDVVKIGDKYVMYYSLSIWNDPNPGIGKATADHPAGPWTDHGKFFRSAEIGVNNSIDPMVFVDHDESVYLLWGSFRGIYAIRLTNDGLDFYDGSLAAAAENKVHLAGYETDRGLEISTFEAVYLTYRDGYYYMFLSNGECCSGAYSYNVRVGRATSVLGDYTDSLGRSMRSGDVGSYVIYGNSLFPAPGHNSVVIDDAGDFWLLYHAYVGTNRSRRVLLLDKLLWDEQGFPSVFGTTPSNNKKMGPRFYDYGNA